MKQKVIICGAGRGGTSITEHLSNEGFDITVIDSNSEAIQRITELYDVQGVLGLASYPNVLEDAGIVDTDLIIAVTQSDEINIAACHVAKSIFGTPTMIIRIRSKEYFDPKYSANSFSKFANAFSKFTNSLLKFTNLTNLRNFSSKFANFECHMVIQIFRLN